MLLAGQHSSRCHPHAGRLPGTPQTPALSLMSRLQPVPSACSIAQASSFGRMPGLAPAAVPLQEGYARWELFRQKGLDLYAAHRNNALKRWRASLCDLHSPCFESPL